MRIMIIRREQSLGEYELSRAASVMHMNKDRLEEALKIYGECKNTTHIAKIIPDVPQGTFIPEKL